MLPPTSQSVSSNYIQSWLGLLSTMLHVWSSDLNGEWHKSCRLTFNASQINASMLMNADAVANDSQTSFFVRPRTSHQLKHNTPTSHRGTTPDRKLKTLRTLYTFQHYFINWVQWLLPHSDSCIFERSWCRNRLFSHHHYHCWSDDVELTVKTYVWH